MNIAAESKEQAIESLKLGFGDSIVDFKYLDKNLSKEEYLDLLPLNRKADLYRQYLEYNKYFDDLEDEFNKSDFNSYIISDLIDRGYIHLEDVEWEIYNNLERGD